MMILCWITYFSILISVVYGNFARKIYGGKLIRIYLAPYVVSIQVRNHHICGGSIISDKYVLTAANCVLAEENVVYGNIQVLAGTHDITDSQYGQIHKVSNVIFHEFYNPRDNWINDIAILKLETPIVIQLAYRELVRLPLRKCLGNRYHTSGWGIDPITHDLSTYLQRISIHTVKSTICRSKYSGLLIDFTTQHCFFPSLSSTGLSPGAGGSPIMYGRQIAGIISFDSLDVNDPAVYTDVVGYKYWMEQMKAKTIY
ncbi:hypothetical protein HCN44_003156 [Aphidius gifuensis]|uniref:Peptidase S1 domain-containing protein n=1 Tax=Aphidius gifuensis TaxID=684658 RepID=A0A835CLJ3_APHGI|nr:ovochymase-2-like [Aphidius gifuensis]KAF7987394.1 hypothetical protein HCN44_003156 [Aphidius gifuensis]